MKRILIVAGEASADRYGARLVEVLRGQSESGLQFFGTGGHHMERAGVKLLCHVSDLASIGPREAVGRFKTYIEVFHSLLRQSAEDPPDLAILLDFPEFNLRLAKKLKRLGIKVIYYISPQLWAWRSGRVKIVKEYVDKMLVILPFEVDFYRRLGVEAEFVGHPLMEEDFDSGPGRERFLAQLQLDPGRKTVALLPGSRAAEVEYILPTLLRTALEIQRRTPCQFMISAAPSLPLDRIRGLTREVLGESPQALYFKIVTADARLVLANSDFALVKSGTSTLEAALVGTPFIIVYKISAVSWWLGNILIRSPFKGLVNLIAGREVVPEFMQGDASVDSLAAASMDYLTDPKKVATMRTGLGLIRQKLGARSASETAASIVHSYL